MLKNNKNLSIGLVFALFVISFCFTSYSYEKNSNTFVFRPTINSSNSLEINSIIEPISSFNPSPPYSSLNETVVLIIENTIWGFSAVQTAVDQYEQDLKDTGYTIIKHTDSISTVQNLKNLLQSWYINNHSVGAVLIGNLPYAEYYHPADEDFSAETFICDLYLMDMDGNWWDLNADDVYDKHNASIGADIYPEIYVGRIDATNRALGDQTNSQDIITLLNRIHSYRIGGVSRSHRAITYIDDDWQAWANGTYDNWPGWLNNAYSNRTDVHTPTTATNANDWLNTRLLQDYEFAHLCVHSGANPGTHYFGPGGIGEGTITSSEIHTTSNAPAFNFYNLFACHGADWITTDCLATTYLFSGSRSISVLSSTKTGGMLGGTTFYNSLGNSMTFGKALHDWYQSMTTYSSSYVQWFYGMSILGDPFSTIHYDCTVLTPKIYSITHPISNSWSSNSQPLFNWTKPSDVNGIAGYYYIIDQNPTTIPTSSTGIFTNYTGVQVSSSLSDGSWYIHVVAKDNVGNIGNTADHYQVNIDTTGPTLLLTSPVPSYNSSINIISLTWSANDLLSGYLSSSIWFDSPSNNVYSGILQNTIISNLTQGIHIINITALDNVMNINTLQFSVYIDLTNPILIILSPLNQSTTESEVHFSWSVTDGETGYNHTEIYIDDILRSKVYAPLMSHTISNLDSGQHIVNITCYDWSGRSTSKILIFTVKKPAIPGYPNLLIIISVLTMIGIIIVWRKRFIFLFK